MQSAVKTILKNDCMSPGVHLRELLEKTKSLVQQLLPVTSQSVDLGKLLEARERLDELIRSKFTREMTVMFTDCAGLTSLADTEGDIACRMLIKRHHDAVLPIIEEAHGVLVKTMGDGTLSYFKAAPDAVRAAVRIQRGIDDLNRAGNGTAIALRIGMNTGMGIVEENDIFGDVVNTASRFESLAGPGEIFISEATYNAFAGKDEFPCRYIQTTSLKGKNGAFKVFKVFWNEGLRRLPAQAFCEKGLESDAVQHSMPLRSWVHV